MLRPKPEEDTEAWLGRVMETKVGAIHTFFWFSGCVFWAWLAGTFVYRIFHSFFLNR